MGNSHVNRKGKIHGGGEPKPTHAGMDLSKNATNCISKYGGIPTEPVSPSANKASINAKRGGK